MATLTDLLYVQQAQVALLAEFAENLGDHDAELVEVKRVLDRVRSSQVPMALELTWLVLCVFYVEADAMLARLARTTPASLLRGWFGSAPEYRARMEQRLCGEFKLDEKRRGRNKVAAHCWTPLEIVSDAWASLSIEVTKPQSVVAAENGWGKQRGAAPGRF
jgi:hypothetical protein